MVTAHKWHHCLEYGKQKVDDHEQQILKPVNMKPETKIQETLTFSSQESSHL